MRFEEKLKLEVAKILASEFSHDVGSDKIIVNQTNADVSGDYTIVLFPFVKALSTNPNILGEKIGSELCRLMPEIESYEILKGFLNLHLSNLYYQKTILNIAQRADFGKAERNGSKVMVEFSSPNTNKPLHLGHIRNILLGWSTAQILDWAGYDVIKTQVINDRGIAICKSMLAWLKYGENKTPESESVKGDHFVGAYYVLFEKKFKEEYKAWQLTEAAKQIFESANSELDSETFYKNYKNNYFNVYSELGREAKDLLLKWEEGDKDVLALWKRMNSWVYEGFEVTYRDLGVNFDSVYYESDTYLLGKEHISKGLKEKIFFTKEDNSVWIDLEDVKLGEKIVLRADGTSLYITQDIGTCEARYKETGASKMIYVVADEQDYHFKVLFEIMKRFKVAYADGLHHLSYGMVDLPSGKMKSREGTVVDADDLIAEIISEARLSAESRGELDDLTEAEQAVVFERIGLAALKFFILKVNARKRMVFDPKESLDMQGQTGPYIQNAFVRIESVIRKNSSESISYDNAYMDYKEEEKALIKELSKFPVLIQEAARTYEPSLIANYCYVLAKLYHRFYHECRILSAPEESIKNFRLLLSNQVAKVLETAMQLLGIDMPQRM